MSAAAFIRLEQDVAWAANFVANERKERIEHVRHFKVWHLALARTRVHLCIQRCLYGLLRQQASVEAWQPRIDLLGRDVACARTHARERAQDWRIDLDGRSPLAVREARLRGRFFRRALLTHSNN